MEKTWKEFNNHLDECKREFHVASSFSLSVRMQMNYNIRMWAWGNLLIKISFSRSLSCIVLNGFGNCLFIQVTKEKYLVLKERLWLSWRIIKIVLIVQVFEGLRSRSFSKKKRYKKYKLSDINHLKYLQKTTCLWKPVKRLKDLNFYKLTVFRKINTKPNHKNNLKTRLWHLWWKDI